MNLLRRFLQHVLCGYIVVQCRHCPLWTLGACLYVSWPCPERLPRNYRPTALCSCPFRAATLLEHSLIGAAFAFQPPTTKDIAQSQRLTCSLPLDKLASLCPFSLICSFYLFALSWLSNTKTNASEWVKFACLIFLSFDLRWYNKSALFLLDLFDFFETLNVQIGYACN